MSFNPDDFKAPTVAPFSTVTVDGEKVEWDTLSNADLLIGVCGKRSVILNIVENVAEVVVNVSSDTDEKFTNFSDPDRKVLGTLVKVIGGNVVLPELKEAVFEEVEQDVEQDVLVSETIPVSLRYYEERECKHCGAPMGVRPVLPEEYLNAFPSRKNTGFTNHTDDEVLSYGIDPDKVDGVVMTYPVCGGCRSYEC